MTPTIFEPGHAAVVTGGASGIGAAIGRACAARGMRVLLADRAADRGRETARAIAEETGGEVLFRPCDVSRMEEVEALRDAARDAIGPLSLLCNNAGLGRDTGAWTGRDAWEETMAVNFWEVVNGMQAFLPDLVAEGAPAAVVNTGSKQGITNPPGNPAYNVSKAAVKAATEQLAHELRSTPDCPVTAHLLIPGWTFTGITAAPGSEKPAGAWTADQVAETMLERVIAGDFYILCPDNDTPPEIDAKRIAWGAGDIAGNRPALSRWDPDWAEAFAAHMAG